MKIVSHDGGIAALRFVADEVKPVKGYYIPTIIAGLTERYSFTKPPTPQQAADHGARFQFGRMKTPKSEINITDLGLFNDGVTVTTTDTRDSEVVLRDVMQWLRSAQGFREPTTKPLAAFQSDLIVEFKNDPEANLGGLATLFKFLERQRAELGHQLKPIKFNRLALGADPLLPGPNADFIVERRAGTSWELNHYFCKAHLPTDVHIEALEILDGLLGKKR